MAKYLCSLFMLAVLAYPASIVQTVTFSPADLNFSQANGFDVITLNGALSTAEEGKPLLPMANVNLLIPPSAEIKDVRIRSFDRYEVPGVFYIHPVQTPRPLSIQNPPPFVQPDPTVYASDQAYPATIASVVPSGCMSGYRIAGVKVCPVQYTPANGKLVLFTRLELEIEYTEGVNEIYPMTDNQIRVFSEQVANLVINADQVQTFAPPQKESFNNVDYVIITSSALVSAFTPLKNWKTKKGLNTVIMPLDTIYARYAGRDNPEKIRNFIIDYWRNKGLVYVLLGGDDVVVPFRNGYLPYSPNNVPADLYFADLQWSWDGNRNNQFGELVPADTADLFYDVFVGRAPVDHAAHVANFIRKDTLYEKHPDTTYLKRILLPSELFWGSNMYHGRICNGQIANYFPATWRRSRLDDPTGAQIRDSLNVGYNFSHPLGHGSPDQVGVFTMALVPTLTNATMLDIMMSTFACDCGSFDGKECIAESLINYPGGGCVADILNSRYGWAAPPTMGPGEHISVTFYRGFVQNRPNIGKAIAYAKDYLRNVAKEQLSARWAHYSLNLFGDPELPMWRDTPKRLTVNHPASIPTGATNVRVTASFGGSPVKEALVCVMKGTEFHAAGYTNSLGWVDLVANATTVGTMDVTVTARDCYPYEATATVSSGSPAPCLAYQSCYIDDGNNHRFDPGETANLYVTLKNAGNAVATNVRGTLRTTCSHLTLLDSTSNYANIAAGDTARGDFYRVTVSAAAPQGAEAELIVNAAANEGTWQPFVKTTIGQRPDYRVWATHDTAFFLLSVTALGSIGTTDWRGEGHGFVYPETTAWTISKLQYGSMLCGTDPTYIVDRSFGVPCSVVNKDFRILDSIVPVIPPLYAHEEFRAIYDDGYHPVPRGIRVNQHSLTLSAGGYDDFGIIIYDYYNTGASQINSFYSALLCDFKCCGWSAMDLTDFAYTNTNRRFAFMKNQSYNPTVGVRLLDPRTACNLSVIDHQIYTGMTESVKDSFMTAKKTVATSNRAYNWSVLVSAGPQNIPAGGRWRVVYAIVGGRDTIEARVHSDSAQSWYDRFVKVEEEPVVVLGQHARFKLNSRIFTKQLAYAYELGPNERITVHAFDISGRQVASVLEKTGAATGTGTWQPEHLAGGIYFLKINDRTEKVIYLR